mmetsp:Transcript_8348/g.20618  ORF Transcript_8348/g.20618 Transcript_8348/m.20618 type:complete len:85 (+) Transcript_8348:169-423(+)
MCCHCASLFLVSSPIGIVGIHSLHSRSLDNRTFNSRRINRNLMFGTRQNTLVFQAMWAPIAANSPRVSNKGPYKIMVLMKQCIP